MNRDLSETIMDNYNCEFSDGSFKKVWDNIHENKAFENVLNLSRNNEEIEETGTEMSGTEAKKTSLDRKPPNKLSPTKTEKTPHREVVGAHPI